LSVTQGEAGTGNVIEAVKHARLVAQEIKEASAMDNTQLEALANKMRVPCELLHKTVQLGRLPVVTFAAGGIATPADAALMMKLGMDGVFVGSGIFKSDNPSERAKAIVAAVSNYNKPEVLAKVSAGLGGCMPSLDIASLSADQRYASRGN
jgi:pyridoxal 5'-phosphate synthase pdxS subunit